MDDMGSNGPARRRSEIQTDHLEQLAERRRKTQGSRFWKRLRSERKAAVGLVFVAFLVFVSVAGAAIAPYDVDSDEFGLFQSPSMAHPLGTDSFGRDLLSRLIVGTRVSFTIGVLAAAASMIVGVTLGLVAGYYGGWADSIIMRFIDILWAFPVIIITVGMVAVFGAGARNVVIAVAIAFIDDFARVVRGSVLSIREEEYTVAARAAGARNSRIIVRHVLPNIVAPIIVQATFAVGLGILAESGLTFLGLGVNPATPTWGQALNESRDFIRLAWWLSVFPGLAIVFTVLSLNLFGDGLRDTLDVRGVGD